jgi:hypothetical protein
MNNYLKIGMSAVVGAAFGAVVTYVVMERLINWFDLVFASARADVTTTALETFDNEGSEKGVEAIRDILKTELDVAKAKCDYFNCSDNPDKYASELRAIDRASQYLERIPITSHSSTPLRGRTR